MQDSLSDSLEQQLGSYKSMGLRRKAESDREPFSPSEWTKFAAATGASLLGAASADAAINHVVPPSPILVDLFNTNVANFDLDGVGGNDMQIGIGATYKTFPYYGYQIVGTAYGLGNASLIGGAFGGPFGNYGIHRFNSNDAIPAVAPATVGSIIRVSSSSQGFFAASGGQWSADDVGFAGFVMGPSGSKQAGWIKIRTESFVDSFDRLGSIEILEWAFETVPGVAIMAGQTSSGSVPGDYNNNGTVGPEDYDVWKSTFNSNVTAGTGADGNSDGTVNAADYTVWRDNLDSAGSGALAASVPEPTSVTLGALALGAAGVAALRRRTS